MAKKRGIMQRLKGLLLFIFILCAACSPQVTITAPDDGAVFDEGETVTFACTATDFEDGDLSGESVVWYADSADNDPLGTGTVIEISALSQGSHTIAAVAVDSDSRFGTDTITITVGQPGTTTTTTAAPAIATIGIGGGTISVGQATLEIPAGALTTDTQISLSAVDSADGFLGAAYDVQPDGLQLAKPAVLTIDYAADALPEGAEADDVAIVSLDEHYEPAQDDPVTSLLSSMPYYLETSVDEARTAASAQIGHFSVYGLKSVCTWEPVPGKSAWFVHPTMKLPCDAFDHGETLVITETCSNCFASADADYFLAERRIDLDVQAGYYSGVVPCAGDFAAQGLIAKVFRVKTGQGSDTVAGVVGCTIVDIGGTTNPQTGNCNVGERRVRVMDLGTGDTINKQIPLQLATAGDEWLDMPAAATGKSPTPHTQTSASGQDYVLPSVTFAAGHYLCNCC